MSSNMTPIFEIMENDTIVFHINAAWGSHEMMVMFVKRENGERVTTYRVRAVVDSRVFGSKDTKKAWRSVPPVEVSDEAVIDAIRAYIKSLEVTFGKCDVAESPTHLSSQDFFEWMKGQPHFHYIKLPLDGGNEENN